jgi:hypothetical protein
MERGDRVLASIGECVYCGAVNDLTDEHIVPLALGGNLILADASCHDCATATGKFEQRVLRGFMKDARSAGSFPTRRPKERPLRLAISRELLAGRFEEIEILAQSHPGFLHLPLLKPAGILNGNRASDGTMVQGFETIRFGPDPSLIAQLLNTEALRVHHRIYAGAFARMLAKIGYCFAISQHGLIPREHVPVLAEISGNSDQPSRWLGSAEFGALVELDNPQHVLATCIKETPNERKEYLVARVKLFSSCGATGYEVVIAETAHIKDLKAQGRKSQPELKLHAELSKRPKQPIATSGHCET